MQIITFTAIGIPRGQPRPRAFARKMGNKFVARVFNPSDAEGWKSCIALAANPYLPSTPLEGPISLRIDFDLPRPQSRCRRKDDPGRILATCKPDVDNAAKAVMDCLTTLGMWRDDNQVCELIVSKHYHAIGGRPGARVQICELEETAQPREVEEAELFEVRA